MKPTLERHARRHRQSTTSDRSSADKRPLTLASFSPYRCQFIERDDFLAWMRQGVDPFCGAPALPGSAWCALHRARCYVRRVPRHASRNGDRWAR